MKRFRVFLCVFFLSSILLGSFPGYVRADYKQAYNDYQFQYDKYRKSFSDFTVANAAYKTYQTLTTQNNALEKMRGAISARASLTSSYLDLIDQKLLASETMDPTDTKTFSQIFATEKTWLTDHKKKISSAGTISDLNDVSSNFDQRFPQIQVEYEKAIGTLLVSKTDNAYLKVADFITRTSAQLDRMDQLGEDTSTLRRSISSAKEKTDQYTQKRLEAEKAINPDDRSFFRDRIDLISIQKLLNEGLQYTKEGMRYLREIVISITK